MMFGRKKNKQALISTMDDSRVTVYDFRRRFLYESYRCPDYTPYPGLQESVMMPKLEEHLDQPVMLTEKQVRFVPDSASYLDEKSALKTIRPIADYLAKYDRKSILLAGTTAGDEDNEESRVLSQKRAETVKASLVAMGISESRIQTIGLGSSDPWHVPGAGFDGPIASGNRKVVIMDISSEDARKILGN